MIRQFTDVPCDKTCPEIAIGLQHIGGATDNRGVTRQIDGVGDNGGGGIGLRGGTRQHRHGVGNAK